MSSRRQISIPLGGRYKQVLLYNNSARKVFTFFLRQDPGQSNGYVKYDKTNAIFVQSMAVLTDGKYSTMAFRLSDDILLPNAAFTHTIDTCVLH